MHTGPLLALKTVEDATVVGFPESTQLDALVIQQIAEEFRHLVHGRGRTRLVVDLSGVELLSSSALSVLMKVRREVCELDGDLVLCSPGPELRKIFKLTNLDRMFRFGEDLEAALKELAAAPAGGSRGSALPGGVGGA